MPEHDQSSLISFRPVSMHMTKARTTKAMNNRATSRSHDGARMNCGYGNLSRSIQDSKPKGYEKATVAFVSKVMPSDANSQKNASQTTKDLFKHLKNATMGGNGDFFAPSKHGSGTSLSNRKQY